MDIYHKKLKRMSYRELKTELQNNKNTNKEGLIREIMKDKAVRYIQMKKNIKNKENFIFKEKKERKEENIDDLLNDIVAGINTDDKYDYEYDNEYDSDHDNDYDDKYNNDYYNTNLEHAIGLDPLRNKKKKRKKMPKDKLNDAMLDRLQSEIYINKIRKKRDKNRDFLPPYEENIRSSKAYR